MTRPYLLCVALLLAGSAPCHAGGYAIYDIGTSLDGGGSYGKAINSSGTVMCSALNSESANSPFTWTKEGGIVDLGPFGVMPYSINDRGQMLAVFHELGSPNWDWRVREASGATTPILSTGPYARLTMLNNSGQVAGFLDGSRLALIEPDGSILDIPNPGGSNMNFEALSDSGKVLLSAIEVAGGLSERAWTWDAGNGLVQLASLEGDDYCIAYGINSSGCVVGRSHTKYATRWNPDGTKTNLGFGCAYAINDLGQIAGTGSADMVTQPLVWNPDGTITYLGLPEGAIGAIATGINNAGQVIGTKFVPVEEATYTWYCPMAVMWDPVPEPPAVLALAAGVGVLVAGSLRRRRA